MNSAKQSNGLLGKVPANLVQAKEPPIYLTLKEVAELLNEDARA